ncbi:restriction endonuclease subunit S [Paenisporosarcina sp. FSL H8-0542]|uniref:restriction endonuclease subunit S n=1 Tax=Paenisporosarcina sp. FSL H8-0542 TaxID=2921401 RepID=UPI00315A33AE
MKIDKSSEVRFSEFKGNWLEYKLGELYTERKEKGQDSLPMLSVSIHNGISDGELDIASLGKSVVRSEDKSLYKRVYPGDLVLNMMRAWQGAYGVVTSAGMVSPAYITATPGNQIYPPFMDYCLHRDEMVSQINNLSYGVTDFRKRLYWKSFIKISCLIPSIPEQKAITSFLIKVDKLILNYQQELTTLKKTKRGFLQKMFPKEGEAVPEVRFAGFSGEWNQRSLRELIEREKKGKAKLDSLGPGEVEYLDAARLNGGDPILCGAVKDVYEDDILILWDGSKAGSVYHGFEGVLGSTLKAYTILEDADPSFVYQYLVFSQENIFDRYRTPNIPHVIKDFTDAFNIPVPLYEEQIQIGNFFKQLDELIALQEKELDALKKTKKAFLQKMFV